jgi:hypothetical protein
MYTFKHVPVGAGTQKMCYEPEIQGLILDRHKKFYSGLALWLTQSLIQQLLQAFSLGVKRMGN